MQIALNGSATMTSREIADLTEKRHDNVKRTVEMLVERGIITLPQIKEVRNHGSGPSILTAYILDKRQSYILVAQLSPEFTARLVDRWQELETAAAPKLPQTMAQALRLAADQAEQLEAQQALIAQQQPAVEFVGRYVEATGLKGFREVAKLLKIKEPAFRAFLEAQKIMYQLGGTWTAYAQHIDAGRFEVRTGESETGHAFNTCKFTPKGVSWVAGEYAKAQVSL